MAFIYSLLKPPSAKPPGYASLSLPFSQTQLQWHWANVSRGDDDDDDLIN